MTDAPTRRLFFALWPNPAVRRTLRRATRNAVRHCGGRPVPPDNYHITLAFLGNVAAELFPDIVAGAATVPVPAITLTLDQFGYWPRPRVLWLGPRRCPQTLTVLADKLWSRMGSIGLPRERRVYQPHLTLCRKVRAAPSIDAPAPVRWPIATFALVESVTAAGGSRYTVVERFPVK